MATTRIPQLSQYLAQPLGVGAPDVVGPQCLAVIVASPRLLDADCRTLPTMELVDGVCRFVEMAQPLGDRPLLGRAEAEAQTELTA